MENIWNSLKNSRNWEEDEYQGKSNRGNRTKTEGDFYLEVEMGSQNVYIEGYNNLEMI